MLTRIDVESENAFFVPIFGSTTKDSLLLRHVTGLTPPDINLFIGDYSRDGGIYQGRRVGNRNVVITFDMNPNPALGETVSGLREMLYKAFLDPLVAADYVRLLLHDDLGRVLYVVGYTEKFETEIFASETTAQISIICPDPYIRDDEETILTHPTGWTTVPFAYGGSAETGFEATIHITAETGTLTLENNGQTMVISRPFDVGEIVRVKTVRGYRSITVETPPVPTPASIVANLSASSPWLELHSQTNTMKVYGTAPTDVIAAIKELRYTQAYWGI